MIEYWIWLTQRKNLSIRRTLELLRYFGTPEAVYFAPESELAAVEGSTERERLSLSDKSLQSAREILENCSKGDIRIVTFHDSGYPSSLRAIEDPPLVLYYRGKWPSFETRPVIGVVGSRRASAYGLTAAKRIGYQLAKCGGIVVSGLAKGIDAAAMSGALTAGEMVVGVLGCGVDVVYPTENRSLFEDMVAYGCLISEYPPGTPPLAGHFPVRNRIISGLSNGVVVVEAPLQSGALITARQALEQGRDVFAVPGNIGVSACEGSNRLIKEGAGLVESGWDILREYEHLFPQTLSHFSGGTTLTAEQPMVASPVLVPQAEGREQVQENTAEGTLDLQEIRGKVSDDEWTVLQVLGNRPLPIDEIIDAAQLPASRVSSAMTLLEIKGYVRRKPGNRFLLGKK